MKRPTIADFLEHPERYPTIASRPGPTDSLPRATLSTDNRYMLRRALEGHPDVAYAPQGPSPFPYPLPPWRLPRMEPQHVSTAVTDMGNYPTFADYANAQPDLGLVPPRTPLGPDVMNQEVGLLPGNGSGVHNDAQVAAGGAGAMQAPPPPNTDATDLMRALMAARRGAPTSINAQQQYPQITNALDQQQALLALRQGKPIIY